MPLILGASLFCQGQAVLSLISGNLYSSETFVSWHASFQLLIYFIFTMHNLWEDNSHAQTVCTRLSFLVPPTKYNTIIKEGLVLRLECCHDMHKSNHRTRFMVDGEVKFQIVQDGPIACSLSCSRLGQAQHSVFHHHESNLARAPIQLFP